MRKFDFLSTRVAGHDVLMVSGRVCRGRGLAAPEIRYHAKEIRQFLKEEIIEGSLNILLKRPLRLHQGSALQITVVRGSPPFLHWPAQLNGTDVWLNRWRAAPLHIVEVLSSKHLRTYMNLSDGDVVRIAIRKCDVGHISGVGWLTWFLFWSGRKSWAYTRDEYNALALPWCMRFGATQLHSDASWWDLLVALAGAVIRKVPGVRALNGNSRHS